MFGAGIAGLAVGGLPTAAESEVFTGTIQVTVPNWEGALPETWNHPSGARIELALAT